MRYGICNLSVVPMRKEASHTSELVSELLFNDIYKIIDENDEWLKIQCMYDSYEGWIRKLQHNEITDNELNEYLSSGEIEELADLEEVLRAILDAKNTSYQDFEQIRQNKVNKRGAFKDKIFLESVDE